MFIGRNVFGLLFEEDMELTFIASQMLVMKHYVVDGILILVSMTSLTLYGLTETSFEDCMFNLRFLLFGRYNNIISMGFVVSINI